MKTHAPYWLSRAASLTAALLPLALSGCTGSVDPLDNGEGASFNPAAGSVDNPNAAGTAATTAPGEQGALAPSLFAAPTDFGVSGARRLTRTELRRSIADLTGVDVGSNIELLPVDDRTPFDNDYTTQTPSRTLIEATRSLAERTTESLLTDPALVNGLLTCQPSGPDDVACLKTFITEFGRRALRRPLSVAEVDELASFISASQETGDFHTAVALVLRTLLQDIEFLYRIEIGTPVAGQPGLFKLSDHEVAARLSYFLWGSTPDTALLDAADAGSLTASAGVQTQVERMLSDPRATARFTEFHAMWLGYDDIPLGPDLAERLRAETDALVEKVVMTDRSSWKNLFISNETFVDSTLAAHYGLPEPGAQQGWVNYPDRTRGGILSHGSFLSAGAKFGDTSPVLRGIVVRERVMCQHVPPPDPTLAVNVDEPPEAEDPNACKVERYAAHRTGPCAGCHALIDPIGFGLEQYGPAGELRTHDVNRPDCPIPGEGEVTGLGTFKGAGELGQLLIESDQVDACFASQLHRFVIGRPADEPGDEATQAAMLERFRDGYDFLGLVEEIATSPAFRHRQEPAL